MLFLRPIRWIVSCLSTCAVLYVVFFVPVGRRTLWEHARRIAGTPEARELGHDMQGASERVVRRARSEIEHGLLLPGRDGGAGHRLR